MPRSLQEIERSSPSSNSTYGSIEYFSSLPERKALMLDAVKSGAKGSGFLAMPGGIGTYDEIMEMAALWQHGEFDRAIVFYAENDFWDKQREILERATEDWFIKRGNLEKWVFARSAEEAVRALLEYEPRTADAKH